MLRKEELGGVRVDNCSLREALRRLDIYLNSEYMNTVETINMKTIVAAGQEEEVHQCLEQMDLVVPGDKEILQELGILSKSRFHEVQENLLFHEFMKRVQRGHRSIFLLAETKEQLAQFCKYLEETYSERLWICGSYAIEECSGDTEDVVNEINSVTPNVIISILPTPMQEKFIFEHRKMLNAKVWFAIGAESALVSARHNPRWLCRHFLVRRKMKKQIQSYETTDKM